MRRIGTAAVLVAAFMGVTACGVGASTTGTAVARPSQLSAQAAADVCSSALAGDPAVRPVAAIPPSSTVIRCRTDLGFGSTNLSWQVSRSTGPLTELQADLRRPDRIEPGVQFCTSIAMPDYQFVAVSGSGGLSVLRMPRWNCGFVTPTQEAMDSAGFADLGTYPMRLQP